VIRLVELALLYDLPIEPTTWAAVREAAPALPREPDRPTIDAFLALFAHPEGLADALRRLHDLGVLEIVLPGFAHARHLLQFNNYHKYTVDEHCILAVERAVEFGREEGWLGATWRELGRKRPLLLALLLHDLGKGFVEDHSEVGARMAREAAARLELPADEAEIVEFLVLKHLHMAHLAFRRDVGDDSIVVRFACEVGSPEVLRMLSLLTAADVAAVGPGTWTKWKADLLGDLHFRTLGHLDGEGANAAADRGRRGLEALLADRPDDDPVRRIAALLPASYLRDTPPARAVEELGRLARLPADGIFAVARWLAENSTVAVSVGTRESVAPGIFHRVTGALTSQRLEILAAGIHTLEDGLVIDHFTVHDPDFAGEPPPERLAEIAAAIRAALKADRPPEFARRWNPFAPQPPAAARFPTRVLFDNESSRTDTILEVFAHDAPGLLYGIARVLFDEGLSVKAAKIGTHLDQVVDAFHVVDAAGAKLADPASMAGLRRAIEAVVAPVTGPG
jgi:[protein-PII] uridylyltransferase